MGVRSGIDSKGPADGGELMSVFCVFVFCFVFFFCWRARNHIHPSRAQMTHTRRSVLASSHTITICVDVPSSHTITVCVNVPSSQQLQFVRMSLVLIQLQFV